MFGKIFSSISLIQAEQLVFPLKQPNYSMQPASVVARVWQVSVIFSYDFWNKEIIIVIWIFVKKKPETELEKKISEILNKSEHNLKDQKLLTQSELKAIETMNLEEVIFFSFMIMLSIS